VSTNPKRNPLAERLKKHLTEGIDFARGNFTLVTTVVPIGSTLADEKVAAIRNGGDHITNTRPMA